MPGRSRAWGEETVAKVDAQVDQLVTELNRSIAEANRFIADMEASPG